MLGPYNAVNFLGECGIRRSFDILADVALRLVGNQSNGLDAFKLAAINAAMRAAMKIRLLMIIPRWDVLSSRTRVTTAPLLDIPDH